MMQKWLFLILMGLGLDSKWQGQMVLGSMVIRFTSYQEWILIDLMVVF